MLELKRSLKNSTLWTEEPSGLQSTGSQRVSTTEQLSTAQYINYLITPSLSDLNFPQESLMDLLSVLIQTTESKSCEEKGHQGEATLLVLI